MKILFVRPAPAKETIGLQHLMIVEPLELEVLASLTSKDDVPVIVDMILEKESIEHIISIEKPDVFCVTGYITNVTTMIDYCKLAKLIIPVVVTVVGGVHCEVCFENLDNEVVDFRVIRNATIVFPKLLDYLRGKGEFPRGILKYKQEVEKSDLPPFDFYFPIPDRSLTKKYRRHYFYIFHNKVAIIKTSFGCPFTCNFCFCREIIQHKFFERPLNEVVNELMQIKEKNIYIVDDDFLTSRSRVRKFIDANITSNLNKQYIIYGRADFIAENPDLILRFKEIGLKTIIVGFESFFDQELEQYNKKIDSATNEKAMNILNAYDIDCYATIIVSPDWGKDEFNLCKEKLLELGIHYVNLQPFTPLPGTGIDIDFNRLIIAYSDYAKWDLAHVTVSPTKMSIADFYRSILSIYNAVLFQPKVLFKYIIKCNLKMQWKMLSGSIKVSKQYSHKIKEAQNA